MSIQFNRENVNALWQPRGQGNAPKSAPPSDLAKALSDHQLTHQEYTALKTAFVKEHPDGDFEQWLADALDGNLDHHVNASLRSELSALSKQGNATHAISFALNDNQTGYEATEATTYKNEDWTAAAKAADSNKDGRLDAQEASKAADLPAHLKANLTQNRAVLTYNDAQKTLTYYPAQERPQLNARYEDLKLTLDVDLKDVDGLGDVSRNDISGSTSGELTFDWNGPLVDGIRQAVEEESGGWVEADTRWVNDKRSGGPGYIIQARSGIIATRPIIIKSNASGQMYLESPGFGSSVRLRLGEHGLKKYALPKLKAMGLDLEIERKDDRIYLNPKRLTVKNIPLGLNAATAEGKQNSGAQGELQLNLAQGTRFEASAAGLKATFNQVGVQGSSNVKGAAAQADDAPDQLTGRIEAGLNYSIQNSKLDTEVVLKNTTARLSLDAREMEEQLYLPRSLAEKAGDHLQAVLTLEGRYRTVNGSQNEGKVQGFLELDSEKGKAYGRLRTDLGQTRLALSAVGFQGQHEGNRVQLQAQQGQLELGKTQPTLDAHGVNLEAKLEDGALLKQVRTLLNGPQPVALQMQSLLKQAGIQQADLDLLTQGKEEALSHLLSNKTWLSKVEAAVVQVQTDHSQLVLGKTGLNSTHTGVKVSANAQDKTGESTVNVQLTADHLQTQTDQTNNPQQRIEAQNTRLSAQANYQDAQGRVQVDASLDAQNATLELNPNAQSSPDHSARPAMALNFEDSQTQATVKAQVQNGPQVQISGEARGMDLTVKDAEISLDADTLEGQTSYRSKKGSTAEVSGDATGIRFRQSSDGKWEVAVPDARAKVEVELALDAVKELLKGADLDALAALPQGQSEAETRGQLEAAGLDKERAQQAASLIWKPELQHILKTSDFIDALRTSKHLQVSTELAGQLHIKDQKAQGFEAHTSANIEVNAALKTAADQPDSILDIQAKTQIDARSDGQTTRLQTPALEVKAHAQDQQGQNLGRFQARIQDIEAELSEQKQSLQTGTLDGKLDFETTLDSEKIAQIQELLTDFKDDLLQRLDKLGINRQQFENILQAFGKNQLEALFKSFRTEDVAALSEELGLSQRQIKQLMTLLSQEPFQKVVQNLFAYSELLTHANAQFGLRLQGESSQWSKQDQTLLANLKGLQLDAGVQTHTEAGGGSLQAQYKQEQLNYRQQGQDAELTWGAQQANAQGQLHREANGERLEAFDMDVDFEGGSGRVSRQQGVFETQINTTRIEGDFSQTQADGSKGSVHAEAAFERLDTESEKGQGGANIRGFSVKTQGELQDQKHQGKMSGQSQLNIETLKVNSESVTAQNLQAQGEIHSQYRFVDDESSAGDLFVNFATDEMTSHASQGVSMAEGRFNADVHTQLAKDNVPHAEMGFSAQQGQLHNLNAKDGNVAFERLNADLEQSLKTPMASGIVGGKFTMEGYQSENKVQRADAFHVNEIEGTLEVKTDHLRDLLSRSKDAKTILETISQRWSQEDGAPSFFTNDAITLNIHDGQWRGDASDGNALDNKQVLNAQLEFPDLETRLGSTRIQLDLKRLSLDSENKTEVEVSGKAQFTPHQPEFDQSIQALVDQNLKAAGLNLKPEVHFVDGKFEVKIDRWFVDGLVNIDFTGDNIELSIDRAKLLHFLSSKKLAARLSESQLNNYLLDVQRDGNVLNLSLNEFSQSLLHRDNLMIQSVDTQNGKLEASFSYTDTQAYNKGYQARQQAKLDSRLFKTPDGQQRTANALEDRVEDLTPNALQRVFKTASPQQLRQMLHAVGNDYDNIVRKALKHENSLKDYPVANRAILAASLARSSGFFERVDREEKQLIQKLLQSVSAQQQARFQQALSAEEYARVQKYKQ